MSDFRARRDRHLQVQGGEDVADRGRLDAALAGLGLGDHFLAQSRQLRQLI
jgi:hypothetical protein